MDCAANHHRLSRLPTWAQSNSCNASHWDRRGGNKSKTATIDATVTKQQVAALSVRSEQQSKGAQRLPASALGVLSRSNTQPVHARVAAVGARTYPLIGCLAARGSAGSSCSSNYGGGSSGRYTGRRLTNRHLGRTKTKTRKLARRA